MNQTYFRRDVTYCGKQFFLPRDTLPNTKFVCGAARLFEYLTRKPEPTKVFAKEVICSGAEAAAEQIKTPQTPIINPKQIYLLSIQFLIYVPLIRTPAGHVSHITASDRPRYVAQISCALVHMPQFALIHFFVTLYDTYCMRSHMQADRTRRAVWWKSSRFVCMHAVEHFHLYGPQPPQAHSYFSHMTSHNYYHYHGDFESCFREVSCGNLCRTLPSKSAGKALANDTETMLAKININKR